jgi:diguanylate cyclase
MTMNFKALYRQLKLWQAENANVAEAACAINLRRMRTLLPIVALINWIHATLFLMQWSGTEPDSDIRRWALRLTLTHTAMGCTMGALAWAAHRLRFANRGPGGRYLSLAVAAIAMVFVVMIVTIDQRMAPNITTFLTACFAIGVALYLRPAVSAWLYAGSIVLFCVCIGIEQDSAAQLLSNRLHGISAGILGWALSALLWRKFTVIELQQLQLGKFQTELQQKQRELERLTRLDGLTGLFNRNTFTELTRTELARAQRQGSATSLLLLDLDFFKRVNDTWGHPAGDAVLRHVAALTANTVRSTDLVGRLGGEEFIVLLPATSLDTARRVAEKLRGRLEISPVPWENTMIPVTASFGLAGTTATQKREFESLYTDADKALYLAKQRGRNNVV